MEKVGRLGEQGFGNHERWVALRFQALNLTVLLFTQPSRQRSHSDSVFHQAAVGRELRAMSCRSEKDTFPQIGVPRL